MKLLAGQLAGVFDLYGIARIVQLVPAVEACVSQIIVSTCMYHHVIMSCYVSYDWPSAMNDSLLTIWFYARPPDSSSPIRFIPV